MTTELCAIDLSNPDSFWGRIFRSLLESEPHSFELSQENARSLYRLNIHGARRNSFTTVPRKEESRWQLATTREEGINKTLLSMGGETTFALRGTSIAWGKTGVGTDFHKTEIKKLKAWMRGQLANLDALRMDEEIPPVSRKSGPGKVRF